MIRRPRARLACGLVVALAGCGSPAVPLDATVAVDGAVPLDGAASPSDAGGDAGAPTLRGCSGRTSSGCFVLTPAEAGLPAAGVNADVDQYALRPVDASARRGILLVFFNGSGGSPRAGVVSASAGFYQTARDAGLHVFGVSYQSDDSIGSLCAGPTRDACFVPSRTTILTGTYQPGAAAALEGIRPHEGAYERILAALSTLSAADPSGGWDAFFDASRLDAPEDAIRWDRVMVAGHSQGGGHAALIARTHAVARAIFFASPCDSVPGAPASWLGGPDGWATDPRTAMRGLAAVGDTICEMIEANWAAMGVPAAAARADALVCDGETAHGAPIRCAENAGAWARLVE